MGQTQSAISQKGQWQAANPGTMRENQLAKAAIMQKIAPYGFGSGCIGTGCEDVALQAAKDRGLAPTIAPLTIFGKKIMGGGKSKKNRRKNKTKATHRKKYES
jgi:hypothetical protein